MNAAPPVLQAQPSGDAVQPDAPAAAALATNRAGGQNFAAALSDAGGKPVRKSAANKQQDPALGGSSLPTPGNQPPPALSPPPAKTDVSTAAIADAAATANGPPGSAPGSGPAAIAAALTVPANASGATTILSAANLDAAAAPSAAALPEIAPPSGAAAPSGTTAPSGAGTAPGVAPLPAPAVGVDMRTLATPATSTATAVPAALSGNTGTAKPAEASANPGTAASANALNDSTLSNGPAASGTDAAAQAPMAAAIAQGTSVPAPDNSSSDDLTIVDAVAPQGAAATSGPAAGVSAAAPAHALAASISAAATAATAAAVTQALSDAASAADKRSHAGSSDASLSGASLSGASNDGSVGAAQLLTSNTSTDSMPTPTFKVAADVDTAQFGQGVADRVLLMMDGNLTSAKLQINPPALGPIEVRIALQGGHAQVSFSSHSAVTRDALESSSTKLLEMLGSQGFSSVSVDISQRSFQERSPQSQAYESARSISADAPVPAQTPLSIARSASGLLDAYA